MLPPEMLPVEHFSQPFAWTVRGESGVRKTMQRCHVCRNYDGALITLSLTADPDDGPNIRIELLLGTAVSLRDRLSEMIEGIHKHNLESKNADK